MKQRSPLIPALSSEEAARRHEPTAWRLFARRIQRHPYVKAALIRRDYQNGCPWCRRDFRSEQQVQVHHADYDHACTYGHTVELLTPTPKRPTRTYKGPDCEQCHRDCPSKFAGCLSRLVLTHKLCNAHIDEVGRRREAQQSGFGF